MRRWLFMLAGLIVWAVHFMGVYAIASVADVVAEADATPALWAVGGLTLACAAADGLILAAAARRPAKCEDDLTPFVRSIAGLGGGLSLAAVLWQGLPALIGH